MRNSSNTDNIEFVCLTNDTINNYINSIPLNTEEITIWNYKMCLNPDLIQYKDPLIIPSLKKFSSLRCVRFYNERLVSCSDIFPQTVERVYFVCCLVNTKWINACIYGKHLKYIDMSQSATLCNIDKYDAITQIHPALGMLNSSLYPSYSRPNTPSAIYNPKIKRKTIWEYIIEKFRISWFIKPSTAKIFPQRETIKNREIELTQYVRLENPNVKRIIIQPTPSASNVSPSLESIKRFKKTYEFLISENIIKVFVEDRFP